MKLHRVFLIALMTSVFAVVGCGDSGGNAGNACSGARCQANDVLRGTCEAEYNDCIARGVNEGECVVAAEAICG
jgi:hypothetical protein